MSFVVDEGSELPRGLKFKQYRVFGNLSPHIKAKEQPERNFNSRSSSKTIGNSIYLPLFPAYIQSKAIAGVG